MRIHLHVMLFIMVQITCIFSIDVALRGNLNFEKGTLPPPVHSYTTAELKQYHKELSWTGTHEIMLLDGTWNQNSQNLRIKHTAEIEGCGKYSACVQTLNNGKWACSKWIYVKPAFFSKSVPFISMVSVINSQHHVMRIIGVVDGNKHVRTPDFDAKKHTIQNQAQHVIDNVLNLKEVNERIINSKEWKYTKIIAALIFISCIVCCVCCCCAMCRRPQKQIVVVSPRNQV
eukprot:90029_1